MSIASTDELTFHLQAITVEMTYAMVALILDPLRISCIPAKSLYPQDVFVGLVVDVQFLVIRPKLLIVVCQCRRCACTMRSNGSQAVSRNDRGRSGGGCCGTGLNARSDVAKLPKRVELEQEMGGGSGGFGEDRVEGTNIPNNVVEWDGEVPECCK